MSYLLDDEGRTAAIRLLPLRKGGLRDWQKLASDAHGQWAATSGFEARQGQVLALPDSDGRLQSIVFGMQENGWLYQLASIYKSLPPGNYVLDSDWNDEQVGQASLGWGLAAYAFDRYRKANEKPRQLYLDKQTAKTVPPLCQAQCLVRDLVNTPTEHMGPAELAAAVKAEADRFGARFRVVSGDELLTENFPAIHAVGRASVSEPRLVELAWGDEAAPLLALVGKGVCFDTGGLDLKTTSGMGLMKKDMGGAAHALALARLVMEYKLPIRLLLLIPAVENSVAGNAYRPGDVITTRKGLHIEIGNTDAEGRVVLSDALAFACEHEPDLVIDFATLTGAARVALGADLPPLFSNDADVSREMLKAGEQKEDPMWGMPLYQPYVELIKSPIADLNNSAKSPYGGCITAALFLEHFVTEDTPWVHIDTFAWNQSNRAGRPEGGEALGLRAVFAYLQERYS